MMPATQVKLLRVLQGARSGGWAAGEQSVDVRVIAATNVNPMDAVRTGKLREDLFYRLNVFAMELPPLRDRKEDVPLLAHHFLTEFNARNGKSVRAVDQEKLYLLEQYPFPQHPGAAGDGTGDDPRGGGLHIEQKHLPPTLIAKAKRHPPTVTLSPGTTVDEAERRLINAHARAHAQQQDPRGRDSRHQPQDLAQQVEPDARSEVSPAGDRLETAVAPGRPVTTGGAQSAAAPQPQDPDADHGDRGRKAAIGLSIKPNRSLA